MNKLFSLIKASMYEGMSLFKINTKKSSKHVKVLLPLILVIVFFYTIYNYADMLMPYLHDAHLEYAVLTLFILLTFIMTVIEGVYKASGLLFNCKDDDMLLSLPIKKSTVLFVRVFKFYVFELMFNSLFLAPVMLNYVKYVPVNITFYIVSLIALFLLPIIPIIISCLIGGIISLSSSTFKFKNVAQIIFTLIFLVGIMAFSMSINNLVEHFAEHATSINEIITKLYYPAGAYIKLIQEFNFLDLIIFILIHLVLLIVFIYIYSKLYFNINSRTKVIKSVSKYKDYKIKQNNIIVSLIKKEINRFVTTPVFLINSGFGLVLFIIAVIAYIVKFDSIVNMIELTESFITVDMLKSYTPVLLIGLIALTTLMSSITSSMISLEGKSFNILKSLPVKPYIIIMSKVLASLVIMIPFLLVGSLIVFIRFKFSIIQMILILLSCFLFSLVSETIGILINLKYPKMDASNDTEVVKQSMSTFISVLIGMILVVATVFGLIKLCELELPVNIIMLIIVFIYLIIYGSLLLYVNKVGVKEFNMINV